MQTHSELCNFSFAFSDRQFLINTKHKKENSSNAGQNFSCGKENARSGRILPNDNTGGGAVVLRAISVSTILDFEFQVDRLGYLHTVDHYVQVTQSRLAPALTKLTAFSRRVCVHSIRTYVHIHTNTDTYTLPRLCTLILLLFGDVTLQ